MRHKILVKTKKGAYRLVILGGKRVYKIASLHYFWGVFKNIPHMLLNGDGRFIFKELMWGWANFQRAIKENFDEYRCWHRLRAPFLAATTFSCGIFNVQTRAIGATPTHEELLAAFQKLTGQAQADMRLLDSHCLEPGNFIKTSVGFQLVDYDDGNSPIFKNYPFTVFLERWHKELEAVLIPRIK